MKERILKFIKSAFSESDGSVSASRILAGSTVLSTLVWVSYLVFTLHALPDLSGASLFVTSGFSGYGVNKLSSVLKNKD